MKRLAQRLNVVVLYSPKGNIIPPGSFQNKRIVCKDIPEDFKKNIEIWKIHELYSNVGPLSVSVFPWTTLKNIENFLSKKAPLLKNLSELQMQHQKKPPGSKEKEFSIPQLQAEGFPEEFEGEDEIAQILSEESSQSEDIHSLGRAKVTHIKPGEQPQFASTDPLSLFRAHSQALPESSPKKNSKASYTFYYNGHEITKKNESLFDIMQRYQKV